MSPSNRISVAPAVLRWARESAGFELRLAARRIRVKPESLAEWEAGTAPPTISQLRRAAEVYRRPLAVLLLPAPVQESQPPRDFRVTDRREGHSWSPALRGEFRRAVSQREVFLEIRDLSPESLPSTYEGLSTSPQADAETVADVLRSALAMDSWPAALWRQSDELLNRAIAAVEHLGVLVMQTRGVEPSEMQGFSISEWPFPVIALNGQDPPRRRLFTLLHELCHVTLSISGVCDLHEAPPEKRNPEDEIERYCNEVAAAVLMPREVLLEDPLVRASDPHHEWTLEELFELSKRFGASSEAVLIRLIGLKQAPQRLYDLRKPELDGEYARFRRERKEQQRESGGGPNYYVVEARSLGHGYVGSVLDAYNNRAISSRDVATYLDVRFDQIPELARRVS